MDMHELADRVLGLSESFADCQTRFLADLIRIRSYTGQERAAVDRTLDELRAIGCDEVWMDSAGNALGRIGRVHVRPGGGNCGGCRRNRRLVPIDRPSASRETRRAFASRVLLLSDNVR